MLLIKIISLTKKTKSSDWFSKNDLYIKVRYGEQVCRTTVKWNNNNPVWDETFLMNIDENNDEILFEIYDSDKWSSDELLESFCYSIDYENLEIKKETVGKINIEIGDIFQEHNSLISKLQMDCIKGEKMKITLKKMNNLLKKASNYLD